MGRRPKRPLLSQAASLWRRGCSITPPHLWLPRSSCYHGDRPGIPWLLGRPPHYTARGRAPDSSTPWRGGGGKRVTGVEAQKNLVPKPVLTMGSLHQSELPNLAASKAGSSGAPSSHQHCNVGAQKAGSRSTITRATVPPWGQDTERNKMSP